MTSRINGSKAKPPGKKFIVLEVIATIEAESEEEARRVLPSKRVFKLEEIVSK